MSLLKWVKHLFVPRRSNNHKARILHPAFLTFFVALFLLVQFGLNFFTFFAPSILGFASDIRPEKVIELTNLKRAEQGLSPLSINGKLNEVAQRKAGDMFAFNYWSHTSPSGRDPWSFFKDVGYKYTYAGENLARDFMNSDSVVDAWMNSPSHRDNIVNGNYKEIGLAVVNGTLNGVETTLVVQVFGTPTPAQVAQKPAIIPPPAIAAIEKKVTPTPLPIPKLGEASLVEEKAPLTSYPPLFSPFWMTKTMAIFLLGLVLGALVIDAILVYQYKIVRLSSRNFAHLIFIGTLLLAIILTTPGAII